MDITLLILILLVFVAMVTAWWQGGWPLVITGFKRAGDIFRSVGLRLLLGFTLGGLIQVLVPGALIAEWLGPTSGLKGILIGSYAGVILPGSPYITLPILTSVYKVGAGVGPVIAFLAAMNLISLPGLFTWQIPFLGAKIALTRYVVSLFLPPFIGLAGSAVYQLLK